MMPNETEIGSAALGGVESPSPDVVSAENQIDVRVHDTELAHDLANADNSQRTIEQLAVNLDASGLPKGEIEHLQKTMREKGQELARKAAEEYEQSQARYEKAKEAALGELLTVAEEGVPWGDKDIFRLCVDPNAIYDPFYTKGLTPYQQQQLKQIVLGALGVEEPKVTDIYKQEFLDREDYGIVTTADSTLGFKVALIYRLGEEGRIGDFVDKEGNVKFSQIKSFVVVKLNPMDAENLAKDPEEFSWVYAQR